VHKTITYPDTVKPPKHYDMSIGVSISLVDRISKEVLGHTDELPLGDPFEEMYFWSEIAGKWRGYNLVEIAFSDKVMIDRGWLGVAGQHVHPFHDIQDAIPKAGYILRTSDSTAGSLGIDTGNSQSNGSADGPPFRQRQGMTP
jgi:hypothetical protein